MLWQFFLGIPKPINMNFAYDKYKIRRHTMRKILLIFCVLSLMVTSAYADTFKVDNRDSSVTLYVHYRTGVNSDYSILTLKPNQSSGNIDKTYVGHVICKFYSQERYWFLWWHTSTKYHAVTVYLNSGTTLLTFQNSQMCRNDGGCFSFN